MLAQRARSCDRTFARDRRGPNLVHARRNAPDYDDLSGVSEPRSRPRYADLYADSFGPDPAPAFDEEAAAALAQTHRHQLDVLPRVRQAALAGEPVEAILDAARRAGAAIIVVGSHGRPALAAAFLGSTADAVIRRSGLPVLAIPCEVAPNAGGTVVAVLDEPDAAGDIARHAAAVAAALQAELVTLRVPNRGRVDRRAELARARVAVIAFPRDGIRSLDDDTNPSQRRDEGPTAPSGDHASSVLRVRRLPGPSPAQGRGNGPDDG